jgi:hypothetical protein
MAGKNLLILERSAQNLQKITRDGKTMLEGVFAEFGIENRNGRIYEEKEYLPHLEYLKKDIANGNLLGELDHPERFEVALGSVSHRISELWYDQQKRQVLGRIEILEGTPKGQIAKSLLDAGVPLSISSRAAGTVNEDKTVAIQQIYTYDLVAKPGFESAQLHSVNESANPRQKEMAEMLISLNEGVTSRKQHSINSKFGKLNENISILDLTDKVPLTYHGVAGVREEALVAQEEAKKAKQQTTKINENNQMAETKPGVITEETVQQWTELFTKELSAINTRLDEIQQSGSTADLTAIKKYIEKIRKIQEDSLNWQSEIAKAVNEVATYADTLADKSNKHYKLTKKIVETVDYNAKTLNATQDWTGEVAKVTNAIGETVDHNAEMLNGLNEWTTQIAKGVNSLNEWGTEKAKAINDMHDWVGTQAKAINGMHEWTSSIAKNFNHSVNWTEEMLGRAISKEDAVNMMKYVDLVSESKADPELKAKIDEMLKTNSITAKPLNEANLKGIAVIDTVGKIGNVKVATETSKPTGVEFDDKTKTIVAKMRNVKLGKEKQPVGDDKLQMPANPKPEKVGDDGLSNDPKDLKANLKTSKVIGSADKKVSGDGPSATATKSQNLKLNVKAGGKNLINDSLNKTEDIQARRTKLDEKLSLIINGLEKEKTVDESVKSEFPFTQLLSSEDRSKFANLDASDKQKVATEISKVPTTDSKVIVKLWEYALATEKVDEPLWFKLAPKVYKEAYSKAPKNVQESLTAKSEYFTLNTQYQIDNFWETSDIIPRPVYTLNESIAAVTGEESEQKYDSVVAGVAEGMKRYAIV